MQILKSLGDGVGTAAGVAWPTFGIVSGALGLTVGGTAAVVLGAVSIGLFLLVTIPISYWAHKNHLEQNLKTLQTIDDAEEKISALILNYFSLIVRENLAKNKQHEIDLRFLSEMIRSDIKDNHKRFSPAIIKTMHFLLEGENIFLSELIKSKIQKHEIKIHFKKNYYASRVMHPNYLALIKSGVMGFSAAFGTIAGCSAGTLGLLVGLGVFAGLTSFPFIGWSVLAAALIFGFVIAKVCMEAEHQKNSKAETLSDYSATIHDLENINIIRNAKMEAESNARFKYENRAITTPTPKKNRRRSSCDFSLIPNYALWHKTKTKTEHSVVPEIAAGDCPGSTSVNPRLRPCEERSNEAIQFLIFL